MEDAQQGLYKLKEAMKLANQSNFYNSEELVDKQEDETRSVETMQRM